MAVVSGNTQRWRIEEFHKTSNSGACNVEQTQPRCEEAVRISATILALLAARIERLKALARQPLEPPPRVELSPHEIRALILP